MNEEKVERAINFFLDNQAAHDVRLAKLEEIVAQLAINQDKMGEDLYEGLRQMSEGIEKLTQVCEKTVQQVQHILKLEIRNSTRNRKLENLSQSIQDRIEGLENQTDETD